MILLGLITCIVLRALTAQAEVVPDFDKCDQFFYQGIEPKGMDQNAEKICQMLNCEETSYVRTYYATLYSVRHKIPLYSAYTLSPFCSGNTGRPQKWHLEPQISDKESKFDCMVPECRATQDLYNKSQAISSDYSDSEYDRGQMNPSSFQFGDGHTATFTLTNAAPMELCFNRIQWKNWERVLRRYLFKKLAVDGDSATAFIVTGTVPDPNVWIPQRVISDNPERVSVPSHIWTAVCYKHHTDNTKSLSFSYIGRNQAAEPDIRLMSVSNLNDELGRLYSELSVTEESSSEYDYEVILKSGSIEIFADECFGDNNKLNKVKKAFHKLINLPVNKAVQMSSDIENTYLAVKRTISGNSTPEKKAKVNDMTAKLAFDSMNTYYSQTEDLKIFTGSACLITNFESQVWPSDDNPRNREVSVKTDSVVCLLVPEKQKTAADGSRCSSVSETDDICQCNTGGETKPCCSAPCLYQDDLKSYKCYSGQDLIDCSPRYSLITHNGKRCLDDHPCATYGYNYYWCKTSRELINNWDYCSPPLRNSKTRKGKNCRSNHACAKYGSRNTWCYTDNKSNWDYC